ncbi:MAG: hypothetical protein EOM53_01210 [Alphaproteobacteria bacterium]|nr:hypothetical protein [Alphaproteobacteria bacterium]
MQKFLFLFFVFILPLKGFSQYKSADSYAENIPFESVQKKTDVVRYLKAFTKDEKILTRLIASFIVFNFDENTYKLRYDKRKETSFLPPLGVDSGDVFITRVGTSDDFASLFTELATLAGLKAQTITGYAGHRITSKNKNDLKASWNAVYLEDEWRLLDIAWMMKGSSFGATLKNLVQYQAELERRQDLSYSIRNLSKNKKIDERYFLSTPSFMIKTHIPLEDKWQLLPVARYFPL